MNDWPSSIAAFVRDLSAGLYCLYYCSSGFLPIVLINSMLFSCFSKSVYSFTLLWALSGDAAALVTAIFVAYLAGGITL